MRGSEMKIWQVALAAILIIAAPLARAETIGICASACTLLTGYFPRKDICVMPDAALGFHAGTFPFVTEQLLRIYPEDIRKWIDEHGGLTFHLIWMQRPEIYKFFHKC